MQTTMPASWIVVVASGHTDCESSPRHSVRPPDGLTWHDVSLHDLFAMFVVAHDRSCRRTLAGVPCLGTWFTPRLSTTTSGSSEIPYNLTTDAQCPQGDAKVLDLLGSNTEWYHDCDSATPENIPISFIFKVGSHPVKRKHEGQENPNHSRKRLEYSPPLVECIVGSFLFMAEARPERPPQFRDEINVFRKKGGIFLDNSRFIFDLEERADGDGRGCWALLLHIPCILSELSSSLDTLSKYWGIVTTKEDDRFRDRVYQLFCNGRPDISPDQQPPASLLVLRVDITPLAELQDALTQAIEDFLNDYPLAGLDLNDPCDFDDLLEKVEALDMQIMLLVLGYDSRYLHLFAQEILSGNADESATEARKSHVTEFGTFHSAVLKWHKAEVIQKVLYIGETRAFQDALIHHGFCLDLKDISDDPLVLESFTMSEETTKAVLQHCVSPLVISSRLNKHVDYHLAELKKSAAYRCLNSNASYITQQVQKYINKLFQTAKSHRRDTTPFHVTSPEMDWDIHKINLIRYVGEYSDFPTKKHFADLLTREDSKWDASLLHLRDAYEIHPRPIACEGASLVKYQLHTGDQVFKLMVAFGMLVFTPGPGTSGTLVMPNPVVRNTLYRQLRVITEQAARPKLLETDNVGLWVTTMLDQWLRSRPPPALRGQNSNCVISEMTIQEHIERLINDTECFHATEHRALIEVRVVRDLRVRQAKQARSGTMLKELKQLCDRRGDEYAKACKFGWLDATGDMVAEGAIDLVVLPYPFFLLEHLPKQVRAVHLIELKYISLKSLFQGVFGHQIHLLTDEALEQFADALTRLLDSRDVKEFLKDLPTTLNVPKLMDEVQKEQRKTQGRESQTDMSASRKFPGKGVKITLRPGDLIKSWYQDGTYYRQSLREIMIDATRQVVQYGHCIAQGKNPNASRDKLSYLDDSRIKVLYSANEKQSIAMHVVVVVGTRAVFHSLPSELDTAFHFYR